MDQIVHAGGQPRIPVRAPRPPQRLPAGPRNRNRERYTETHSQPRKQEKVYLTLQKPTAVPEIRNKADQDSPGHYIHREQVLGKIQCLQHGVPEGC